MGVEPKIGGKPQMDGENNGKPDFLMDDLGGKPHYFRKHPYIYMIIYTVDSFCFVCGSPNG